MDKVLLITGASSEIGSSLISDIVSDYSYIWAHYNSNWTNIESLWKQYKDKIIPIKCDFKDINSLETMINTVMESDKVPNQIVHLSAPKISYEKFQKRQWDEYQEGIDTSMRSIVMILNVLVPQMVKNKYGRIVFMLTSYLTGTVPKYQSSYIAVKYALYGLMRSLASELAEKRITVNAVSPDMMETKFLSSVPDVVIRMNADSNPLKRNIKIDDVIPTISYLLSDGADTVTGQNIAITAGSELI